MSTTSTRPALPATTAGQGIPFARLVRAELRKLTDTRASRWLLAAIAAAIPVVVAVMLIVASPRNLTYSKMLDFTQTRKSSCCPRSASWSSPASGASAPAWSPSPWSPAGAGSCWPRRPRRSVSGWP